MGISCHEVSHVIQKLFALNDATSGTSVNVGVITTIWSVQPFIAAIVDYLIYRQKLGFNHLVGMVMIVIGAVSIGFSRI